jgi:hypothetical protein
MTAYLINYSCKSSVKKFKEVDAIIRECAWDDRWMYHLNNTWIIKSEMTADEIGTKLSMLANEHDDFLVIEIVDNYAGWLPQRALDFLREYIFD